MTTPLIEAKNRLENLKAREFIDQMSGVYGLVVIDPFSEDGNRQIEMNKLRRFIREYEGETNG